MSKATEERLTNLLMQVVDDADPTSALTKVAVEAELTAEQIRLLGRAYNTGAALSQIRRGETPQEKSATVPLVDPEEIVSRVFPEKVERPVEQSRKEAVSLDYSLPPVADPWALQRKPSLLKAAEEPPAKISGDPRGREFEKKYAERQRKERDASKRAEVFYDLTYKAAAVLDELRRYFRTPGCQSLATVRENASYVFGKAAELLLDHLAEDKSFSKRASARAEAVDWGKPPYSLVKNALDLATKQAEARAEYRKHLGPPENKPNPPARPEEITGSIWDAIQEKRSAAASSAAVGALTATAVRDLFNRFTPDSPETMVQKQIQSLSSGGHDARLRALNVKTMLHEMMLNDPVLSEYGSDQVAEAFNRLSDVAPRSVQHPLILKSMLRKYLSQDHTLDPFDVSQMLGLEKQLIEPDLAQRQTRTKEISTYNPVI